MVIYPDPGPRPLYRQRLTDEQYAEYQRSVLLWEYNVMNHGRQQANLLSAVRREEARQDNMTRFGMDRVAATKTLLRRKKYDV